MANNYSVLKDYELEVDKLFNKMKSILSKEVIKNHEAALAKAKKYTTKVEKICKIDNKYFASVSETNNASSCKWYSFVTPRDADRLLSSTTAVVYLDKDKINKFAISEKARKAPALIERLILTKGLKSAVILSKDAYEESKDFYTFDNVIDFDKEEAALKKEKAKSTLVDKVFFIHGSYMNLNELEEYRKAKGLEGFFLSIYKSKTWNTLIKPTGNTPAECESYWRDVTTSRADDILKRIPSFRKNGTLCTSKYEYVKIEFAKYKKYKKDISAYECFLDEDATFKNIFSAYVPEVEKLASKATVNFDFTDLFDSDIFEALVSNGLTNSKLLAYKAQYDDDNAKDTYDDWSFKRVCDSLHITYEPKKENVEIKLAEKAPLLPLIYLNSYYFRSSRDEDHAASIKALADYLNGVKF